MWQVLIPNEHVPTLIRQFPIPNEHVRFQAMTLYRFLQRVVSADHHAQTAIPSEVLGISREQT